MEFGFGQDFSQVRVHTSVQGAESARALDARAYTVGRNIVFADGQYAPATGEGRNLLAHELTHVVQQRFGSGEFRKGQSLELGTVDNSYEREADQVAGRFSGNEAGTRRSGPLSDLSFATPSIQRVSFGESVARFFGGGTFSETELAEYLRRLDRTGQIEDANDSDNKARAIVEAWKRGGSAYVLTPRRVILLVKEMQSGFTGDDDEQAILELLERSSNEALGVIFGPGGVNANDLNGDFHGTEWNSLQAFYARRFEGGMSSVLAGNIRPRGAPVPLGVALGQQVAASTAGQRQSAAEPCTVMLPENCPTYEAWVSLFTNLPRFPSTTGHDVLGPGPAPAATATDPNAPQSQRRPPVVQGREQYLPTDRFIDGPTEEWVRRNLPPNLVETAYQLPSDCADIAVILRHVWLAAHRRVETYRGWVCGSRLGEARSRDINELIVNQVYTGSVQGIVNPYTDEQGNRLLSFDSLQRVLHPGDILVWEHRDARGARTGGHTHTIINVQRHEGTVTEITALQGNQPIGRRQAEQMRSRDIRTQGQLPASRRRPTPTVDELRAAPGRRIEVDRLSDTGFRSPNGVWTWDDGTVLLAAGPPAAAPRPAPQAPGQQPVRQLTDWIPALQSATEENLESTFESALLEARATVEAQRPVSDEQASALGQAAGERLRQLARRSGDLGDDTLVRRLGRMRAQIRALRNASLAREAHALFERIERALESAARGISSVDFTRVRTATEERIVNVLLTGFDPFNVARPGQPARAGEWNPSGAAVMQLDSETIDVENRLKAAVEGVVLPVDFERFRSGIVESVVSQHREADAVITVSLDPNIAPDQPARIEQFAVGVHQLENGQLEAIPDSPPGRSGGRAIIESAAPVRDIAAETGRPAHGGDPSVPTPAIGTGVEFQFSSSQEADEALRALGLPPQGRASVTINDVRAVRQIVQTISREVAPSGAGISFIAGNQSFVAILRSGPGGSYLSNEVSYRVLRELSESGRGQTPSFHVHTPRGTAAGTGVIPSVTADPGSTTRREQLLQAARSVLGTLVATLKQIIRAVARRIAPSRRR